MVTLKKNQETIKLKTGFSILGFLFTFLALLFRKQFLFSFISFCIVLILTFLEYNLRIAGSFTLAIFIGLKANEFRIKDYQKKGWVLVE